MAEYYMILTVAGQAAYARAGAGGSPVQISAVAVGDGGGVAVQPAESWVSLIGEVWRGAPTLVGVDAANPRLVLVEAHVPHNVGGWYAREIGLLSPEGVLLAVGNYPESYKPVLDSGVGKELMIRAYIEHGNASQTTLKINPDIVMASRTYVASAVATHDASPTAHAGQLAGMSGHIDDLANPHQVTAAQVGAEPFGKVAWHNGDEEAHPDIRAAIAGIVIPNATTEARGIVELATSAEALLLADAARAMTPAILGVVLTAALAHVARTDVVNAWTRQQYMAQESLLAVSGSLVIDLDTQAALSLQIVGGTVIANPEHTGTQKRGRLMLAASAAHSLSWGSAWKSSSTVTLPTATIAGATIVLDYVCIDGTMYPLWMSTLGLVLSNTDIAPLATLSAIGSQNGGHALPYLVDGNNTTLASFSGTLPAFIFDFGSANPRNIWKLRLGLNGGTINPLPVRFAYSDDGGSWVNTNQSAISKTLDTTITDHLVDNFGSHRFWALMPTSGSWIQFTTIELYPRIGG